MPKFSNFQLRFDALQTQNNALQAQITALTAQVEALTSRGSSDGVPWYSIYQHGQPVTLNNPPTDPTKMAYFVDGSGIVHAWQPPLDQFDIGNWGQVGTINATKIVVQASFVPGLTPEDEFGPTSQYPIQTMGIDVASGNVYQNQGQDTWTLLGKIGDGGGGS